MPNPPVRPDRLEAAFLTSAPDLARCPTPDRAEVAFAGRSNAGKSSVLNQVTGNRRTAKVSRTPGRTQMLNFFDVRSGGRLVDLPGYGYAKAGKRAQADWQASVNGYLSRRDSLVGLVLVIDIRHPTQPFDEQLLDWSAQSELPVHVLLNKADKLSYSGQQRTLHAFVRTWSRHPSLSCQTFSATRGDGREDLIERLLDWLALPIS